MWKSFCMVLATSCLPCSTIWHLAVGVSPFWSSVGFCLTEASQQVGLLSRLVTWPQFGPCHTVSQKLNQSQLQSVISPEHLQLTSHFRACTAPWRPPSALPCIRWVEKIVFIFTWNTALCTLNDPSLLGIFFWGGAFQIMFDSTQNFATSVS